jgi:hypothetical protein
MRSRPYGRGGAVIIVKPYKGRKRGTETGSQRAARMASSAMRLRYRSGVTAADMTSGPVGM